jgi:hypothetical protein
MAKPRDDRQKDQLRPALEHVIDLGHPLVRLAQRKAEHRMGRNHLKGRDGDRTNAILAAAGYNFALLRRWLARLFARPPQGAPSVAAGPGKSLKLLLRVLHERRDIRAQHEPEFPRNPAGTGDPRHLPLDRRRPVLTEPLPNCFARGAPGARSSASARAGRGRPCKLGLDCHPGEQNPKGGQFALHGNPINVIRVDSGCRGHNHPQKKFRVWGHLLATLQRHCR